MTLGTTRVQDHTGCSIGPRSRAHDITGARIPILRSGLLAQELCHHLARAEVIAVFESSFYLRSGHAFVCVGEPAIGNGPLTLIADHAVSELRLRPGLLASISERAIIIGNSVRLTFDQCEPWRPPRWPVPPPHRALKEISGTLTSLIAAEAPVDGLARAPCWNERGAGETRLARIAHERIADFTSWLGDALDYPDHVSPATPAPAIAGLIGLGPGLTPSGDDFLVGALALLDALEKRSAHYALARAIVA